MQTTVTLYLKRFEAKDIENRAKLARGEMTYKEYLEFRKLWIRRSKEFDAMLDDCVMAMNNADKIARQYIRTGQADIFSYSSNYSAYEICKGLNLNIDFTIYDANAVMDILENDPDLLPQPKPDIPKAERWNRHHIQSEIVQGIIQGKTIEKVARGLDRAVNMGKNASVRNARTAMTAARNAGAKNRYKQANDMGIDVKNQWLATFDGKTRHEHRLLDGQIRPLDEPFEVDGEKIRYPADPQAPARLIYNCRCTLVPVIGKYSNNINADALGQMTYDEWVKDKPKYKKKRKRKKQ